MVSKIELQLKLTNEAGMNGKLPKGLLEQFKLINPFGSIGNCGSKFELQDKFIRVEGSKGKESS